MADKNFKVKLGLEVGNNTVNHITANASGITTTGFANIATTLAAGNTSITGTLATGNTTVTGFANVTTTLQSGNATHTGTLATGNTTITGFANVTTTLQVTGAATVSNTLATGNTTITGFANVTTTLQVTGAATFSNTVTLPSGTILSNIGLQSIWVPASALYAVTNPSSNALSVASSRVPYLAYDAASAEDAWFSVAMPKSWDEGTIYAVVYWGHPATTVNFGVVWEVFGQGYNDNEAINGASFTSLGTMTDTGGTTSNLYISPTSAGGAMAGGDNDMINFILRRNATSGSDTLAVDAYAFGVKILYTTNLGKDT